MSDIRAIVIEALTTSSTLMSNPLTARKAVAGQDILLAELEMDSLSRFEVLMEIEDRLGIEVDDDEIDIHGTLDGLVSFIAARCAEAA